VNVDMLGNNTIALLIRVALLRGRKEKLWSRFTFMCFTILCMSSFLLPSVVNAKTLKCRVVLDYFRVPPLPKSGTEPENSFEANIMMDTNTDQWSINYLKGTSNRKFVGTYPDYILNFLYMADNSTACFVSNAKEGYPIDLDGDERLFWFAYCAKNYIRKNEGQPVIVPFSEPRTFCYVDGCVMHAHWRFDADVCPDEATFVYSLGVFEKGIKVLSFEPPGNFIEARERQFKGFKDTHKDGDVVAEFKVSEWQQVGDINIPHLWELDFWLWKTPPSPHGMRCLGRTDVAALTEDAVQLPQLPKVKKINDYRARDVFPQMNYISYTISNGILPKVTDFVEISTNHPVPHFVGSGGAAQLTQHFLRPRLIFTGLLAFLAVGPPLLFLFRRKKKIT